MVQLGLITGEIHWSAGHESSDSKKKANSLELHFAQIWPRTAMYSNSYDVEYSMRV